MYPLLFVLALGVILTRFIPFIILKDKIISKRNQILLDKIPYATMGLLLVYGFKDINYDNLFATVVATTICVIIYLRKRNTILSIMLSTLVYMFIIQKL